MMKQLIFFLSVMVMFFSITSFAANAVELDTQLVLVGVVVDKDAGTPIKNATVTLVDASNGISKHITTSVDGQFYFNLEADKRYNLILINPDGTKEDARTISTINKVKSEILRAMLQTSGSKANAVISNSRFEITSSPSYAKEVK